jgi:hypothetical protein
MANFVISPTKIAMQIASAFMKGVGAEATSRSLIESTRATRVEPLVAIDSTIQSQPYMSDVMQSLCSLVSAYYLQAAAIHTRIGDITILQKLDRLNPERNLKLALYGQVVGLESSQYSLPSYNSPQTYNSKPGLEAAADDLLANVSGYVPSLAEAGKQIVVGQSKDYLAGIKANNDAPGGQQFDSKQAMGESIRKAENMMVGKVLEVEFISDDGTKKVIVPVTVKLIPVVVQPNVFAVMFSEAGLKNTTGERWHRFKAGELSFWGDFVFGNDLIDKHRATLMRDKSGFYAAVSKRRNKNSAAAMASGQASLADASNILVISKKTASLMETELMGKLESTSTRNQLFSIGSLMILAVIDQEMETITVYHRGIDLPSRLNLRDIKSANKGNGVDIAEVLKAYQVNKAPSLY